MTLPQVVVEVGFTSPYVGSFWTIGDPVRGQIGVMPIGPDEVWSDITPWVRSWSVRRGVSNPNQPTRRYEPGTATIVLNDGDRRFDPLNLDGPYVSSGISQITAMRRVRIKALWNGQSYPIYQGYADDWQPDYQGNSWTYVTLTATDATKIFAAVNRVESGPVGAGEDSGDRIGRVLTTAGWPTEDRDIDDGVELLQATTLSGNVLSELQLVQDTELGDFYMDAEGKAVFRNRHAIATRDRSITDVATFGDGGYHHPSTYTFEDGVAAFQGFGATVTASTAQAYGSAQSLLMTVTGSPTLAYARQIAKLPAAAGREYSAVFWVYYPAGGAVTAAIDWFDSSLGYLDTSYEEFDVPAAAWTELTVADVAPDDTAFAVFGPTLGGSPANGTELHVDFMQWTNYLYNELPYADVKMSSADEGMANRVMITRVDGVQQVAEDAASVDEYLVKTYERSDLLMQTDTSALDYANEVLLHFANPGRRFERIEFNTPAPAIEDELWPVLLDMQFGDRLHIVRRPAGGGSPIQQGCFVRGAEHSSDGMSWTSALTLQSAASYSYWTIGDSDRGRIGAYPIAY